MYIRILYNTYFFLRGGKLFVGEGHKIYVRHVSDRVVVVTNLYVLRVAYIE